LLQTRMNFTSAFSLLPSYFTSMSFKSLEHILDCLQAQSRWQEQPFQRLLKCWPEVVGAAVAAHARPISIQRNILWVATSSAVWAQELSFGRQQILERLNARLPSPLLDIRFSTAQWQRPQNKISATGERAAPDLRRAHPSWVLNSPKFPNSTEKHNYKHPNQAFRHWAMMMQARSRDLPLCPQCHCPTPEGELRRWATCSICAAKQW
jgi:predicted nucleic acid-binding Zn ribbon protein